MDSNRETILDELNDFDKKRPSDISTILENYLSRIAKTGDPMFPWNKLKPLIRRKMEIVIADFHDGCPTDALPPLPNVELFKYDDLRCKILEAVDSFPNAPFTIQRLCELLTSPKKHYKRTDKFMRGLEKNILVVSTIEPRSADFHSHSEVNNNNNLMNGIIESSDDILSAENANLNSRSVINGTPPPLSDNYRADFSSESGSIDATADSESSSSSDSDSSSDSLTPDYAKEGQMDSVVDSTSALQVESAMDTSQDLLNHNENSSSSSELGEKEDGMNSESISNLVRKALANSTACQSSLEERDEVESKVINKETLESSECHEQMPSASDETETIAKEEESTSEAQGKESPTKMLLIEEVAISLSQMLDATPEEVPFGPQVKVDCSSDGELLSQEQTGAIEMETAGESRTESTVKCEPDKSEPMEED